MKKNIKLLGIVLIVITMLFCLTGCSDENQIEQEEKKDISEQKIIETNEVEENVTSNVLQVGEYTLKYGTYIGYAGNSDIPNLNYTETAEIIIEINEDGTLTQSGGFDNTPEYTTSYTINNDTIISSNGMPLRVTANDEFTMEVAQGVDFKYKEN